MRGFTPLETQLLRAIGTRERIVAKRTQVDLLVRRGLVAWTTPIPPATYGLVVTPRGELAILCVLALFAPAVTP